MKTRWFAVFAILLFPCTGASQQLADPEQLVQQADRLAWLKNWTRAEPLYGEAQQLFAARGDRRNALYAEINALRAQLPRLPVPEVSQRLADYLDDPIVQSDARLRLRTLVIKGETDTDLDPALAEQSWREAAEIAGILGDAAWANRAEGELGLIAFLEGDISTSVIKLGRALQVAQTNGDSASVIRWLTLFGHGYSELGRPEQALDYYDRALKLASTIPELQFPVMTYLGKGDALTRVGRFAEAEKVLSDALATATQQDALGYESELIFKLGLIANQRKQIDRALDLLPRAADLARRAGGNRILAEIALELSKIERANGQVAKATATATEGVEVARKLHEQLLLPRLLAQLGELKSLNGRYSAAADLLDEASDLLEGLLTKVSSPWVQSRVILGMDDVFLARIGLAGEMADAPRLFSAIEQARGRSLLELLVATPLADVKKPPELRAGERDIAALQLKLYRARDRAERQRLLDAISVTEDRLAPISTELFNRTRAKPRQSVSITELQRTLRGDEIVIEFALTEPDSYCVVATRSSTRVCQLPGRQTLRPLARALSSKLRQDVRTVPRHDVSFGAGEAPVAAAGLSKCVAKVKPDPSAKVLVDGFKPSGVFHHVGRLPAYRVSRALLSRPGTPSKLAAPPRLRRFRHVPSRS